MARLRKRNKIEVYVNKSNKEMKAKEKDAIQSAITDLRALNIVKYGDTESAKEVLSHLFGKAYDEGYASREEDEEYM